MAGAVMNCFSCCGLPAKLNSLSLATSPNATISALMPLSFSSNASVNLLSKGLVSICPVQRPLRSLTVCEAGTKKADSAAKRARQAEKRRVYNKAHKSEIRTRMKKALEAMEVLVKKTDAQTEEVLPIEKLIAEAYSAIDKAVKVGTVHRNTGARRKSRLARRKKAIEIHHGWARRGKNFPEGFILSSASPPLCCSVLRACRRVRACRRLRTRRLLKSLIL